MASEGVSENPVNGQRGGKKNRDQKGARSKKRKEMGRMEWAQQDTSRRERSDQTKRRRLEKGEAGMPTYAVQFTPEEIENEARRPKRKVAVLMGYSGSGYKGLQLNDKEKTIEGDMFMAFVAAGAISKANATDPKKSALVRCARTDKGVHAAGNILSLKLIIEDNDIVQKINENLPSQIRVWGIQPTTGSFSAYQLCDSRIYEYLIPTHCFLPPPPQSFLGKSILELAEEADDLEGYKSRQAEVAGFWSVADAEYIKPAIDKLDPELASQAMKAIFDGEKQLDQGDTTTAFSGTRESAAESIRNSPPRDFHEQGALRTTTTLEAVVGTVGHSNDEVTPSVQAIREGEALQDRQLSPIEIAIRSLRAAYAAARVAYRISPERFERVRAVFSQYEGNHNFHNYTIKKAARDPSAKRHIKSFVVDETPIIINGTEWLSLKVHGQSFMMHQIRKMVSMAAFVVRCGTPTTIIEESFRHEKLSIPKAPGLGLLLERPVFESYNNVIRLRGSVERESIDFGKYQKEIDEFKQKQIYEHIFREEERWAIFHQLIALLDNMRNSQLFYLSSLGIPAIKRMEGEDVKQSVEVVDGDSEGEEGTNGKEEG